MHYELDWSILHSYHCGYSRKVELKGDSGWIQNLKLNRSILTLQFNKAGMITVHIDPCKAGVNEDIAECVSECVTVHLHSGYFASCDLVVHSTRDHVIFSSYIHK